MTKLKKYLNNKQQKDTSAIAFLASLDVIAKKSPIIAKAILQELKDQRSFLKLIASENYSSMAVQLAMGNLLTDKYAEGYPYHRFYAGCQNIDKIEDLAITEAKKIFPEADHAYVQPHSGADANLIAFWSVLVEKIENEEIKKYNKKNINELTLAEAEKIRRLMNNQKMMGLSLESGGHLTHGYNRNISSKIMKSIPYHVDSKTHLLNYKDIEKQVIKEKPLILIAGHSAYPRKIDFSIMKEIASKVKATLIVDMAHFAGLVAGKVFKGKFNPVPYADIVTSTTHKTLRGPRGGLILCKKEFSQIINKGCPLVIGGPLPHVIAAKAIAFQEANSKDFQKYSEQIVINAKALSTYLKKLGAKVITGGTDNHLLLLNIYESFNLTGRQAELALYEANISVNRNCIPNDKMGPWYTSGIRLGTPALTTLGMKEKEMEQIAKIIILILKNIKPLNSQSKYKIDKKILTQAKKMVKNLLSSFLLYPQINLN